MLIILILGLVLFAGGLGSTIYAGMERKTTEYLVNKAFAERGPEIIDAMYYAGIAALALGVILVVVFIVLKLIKKNNESEITE